MKVIFTAPLFASAVLASNAQIDLSLKTASSIKSFTYGGSGCPGGSIAVPDPVPFPTFNVTFPSFVAKAGTGSIVDARKNCQLNVDYTLDPGTAGSLTVKTTYHVVIADGATATQTSTYYTSGSEAQQKLTSTLTGPLDKYFSYTDTVPLAAIQVPSAGGETPININTAVNFGMGGSSTGSVEVQSASITLGSPSAKHFNREVIEH
jgi:hypothetical protein